MATSRATVVPRRRLTHMKVAQIPKPGGDFEIVEREIPKPGARQVRIKVQACGVCHSDLLTKEGAWPIQYPRVPGHEVAGIIDEVGAGVSEWTKGQRVGVGWHGGHDGTCRECRRGDFGNCRNMKICGISYDGGYQQYMIAPAEAVVAIPETLSDVDAAPLLCAGITTYNALRHSGALPGDLVAVQGIGGLGHLGIQFANKFGYKVAAIGRGPENAALAKKLGASVYIDSKATNAAEELQKLGGAQVILATAPSSKAMSELIDGLAPNGKLMVVGVSFDPIEVTPVQLITGSRTIQGWLPRNASRFRRHAALRRIERRAAHDRNLSARKGGQSLRAHDERQGTIPRRANDVKFTDNEIGNRPRKGASHELPDSSIARYRLTDSRSFIGRQVPKTRRRFSCSTGCLHRRECSSRSSRGYPIVITWSRLITPGFGHSDWPDPKQFAYTFDHIAEIMNRFAETLGLSRYTLYMQDYGGPVGFRMALAHPERIEALIVQDAVAHNTGLGANWKTRRAFWADRAANESALRVNLLSLETTRSRHAGNDPDLARHNPDLWTDEFYFSQSTRSSRHSKRSVLRLSNQCGCLPEVAGVDAR